MREVMRFALERTKSRGDVQVNPKMAANPSSISGVMLDGRKS